MSTPTVVPPNVIRTARLVLRPWRDSDLAPFAALNADPEVMRFLPGVLDRAASDALVERIRAHFDRHGFGLWAVEVADVKPFIGYVGLAVPRFDAAFTPCVEIGWRLARSSWGFGYATEAARAVLDFAFTTARLDEVVSFTVPANTRSLAVMQRIGLTHDPADDFDHPLLPSDDPLKRHVLYRLTREQWLALSETGARDARNHARSQSSCEAN